MFCVMHIHEAFPAVRAEFSFAKTIGALSRNMSDMMDEGDIPDILLSQIAEMMECEAKSPDISHMDFLYRRYYTFSGLSSNGK